MKSGDTRITPPLARSTTIYFACGRSSSPIPQIRVSFLPCTARDTNLCQGMPRAERTARSNIDNVALALKDAAYNLHPADNLRPDWRNAPDRTSYRSGGD